jgi:hypothetical protein
VFSSEFIQSLFGVVLGGGFLAGLYKLLTLRGTNKNLLAKARKTDVEATTLFSTSVLDILKNAQKTANQAQRQAKQAERLARMAQEEVAFLRRWIISQGLVPPEYITQLEEASNVYESNKHEDSYETGPKEAL